jgi:hypothetical protein
MQFLQATRTAALLNNRTPATKAGRSTAARHRNQKLRPYEY